MIQQASLISYISSLRSAISSIKRSWVFHECARSMQTAVITTDELHVCDVHSICLVYSSDSSGIFLKATGKHASVVLNLRLPYAWRKLAGKYTKPCSASTWASSDVHDTTDLSVSFFPDMHCQCPSRYLVDWPHLCNQAGQANLGDQLSWLLPSWRLSQPVTQLRCMSKIHTSTILKQAKPANASKTIHYNM